MSRVCEICGKGVTAGGSISRRGMAKKFGGVGSRVIAHNKRVFRPNLQKVRAWVNNGVKRIYCLHKLHSGWQSHQATEA